MYESLPTDTPLDVIGLVATMNFSEFSSPETLAAKATADTTSLAGLCLATRNDDFEKVFGQLASKIIASQELRDIIADEALIRKNSQVYELIAKQGLSPHILATAKERYGW
jgi:hypothetical protein